MKPKFDRSVSMVCWAYNEGRSISDFLRRATSIMDECVEDYEIVLVDDASTDDTYAIALEFQKKDPRLKIFRNERNLNVGLSSRKAIQSASKEYLFWQTIDWSYDISNLRAYLEYLNEYDIVQGVRRRPVKVRIRFLKPLAAVLKFFGMKHLTRRSDTVSKAFVSVINYMLIRVLFALPVSDFQNVTFYPSGWIKSIRLESNSSFANPEALLKSYWSGKSIKEVPVSFIPRKDGKGVGASPASILMSVRDIFRFWLEWIVLGKRGKITKGRVARLNPSEWPGEL